MRDSGFEKLIKKLEEKDEKRAGNEIQKAAGLLSLYGAIKISFQDFRCATYAYYL